MQENQLSETPLKETGNYFNDMACVETVFCHIRTETSSSTSLGILQHCKLKHGIWYLETGLYRPTWDTEMSLGGSIMSLSMSIEVMYFDSYRRFVWR